MSVKKESVAMDPDLEEATLEKEEGVSDGMRKVATELRIQMEQERRKDAEKAAQFFASAKKDEIRKKIEWLLERSAQFSASMRQAIEKQPDLEQTILSEIEEKGKKRKKKSSKKQETEKPEPERPPLYLSGGTLRKYQMEGLQWLKSMHTNGLSGILADEMGLGKTIQSIAMICHLYEYGSCLEGGEGNGPILVIAPLSTLCNWQNEFAKFAPKIPVVLYHGEKSVRTQLISKISKKYDLDGEKHYPVILTSYEIIMRDKNQLARWTYPYILIDEGHRIKNVNCRLVRDLKSLTQTKANFTYQSRLLLTGTPLQNNISELWSLLHFLLPTLFDSFEWFEEYFNLNPDEGADVHEHILRKEEEEQVITKLHNILKPILLRRLKTDVELGIPPKKEIVVYAPLTVEQKEMYKSALDHSFQRLCNKKKKSKEFQPVENLPAKRRRRTVNYDDEENVAQKSATDEDGGEIDFVEIVNEYENLPSAADSLGQFKPKMGFLDQLTSVRHTMMFLRKITMSPYLVNYLEDEEGFYTPEDETLVDNSGKMKVLDQLLCALHERKHKVLLFSQMTQMMDLLGHFCNLRGYKFCRLDGTTSLEDRQTQMKIFNEDDSVFIFLLSTRAGGLGVNLVGADTVIFFDSDWNPQMDLQAQDRCHRIGQTKPVLIYRLVTRGTIDEQMLNRATGKRALEKVVIHQSLYKFRGNEENEYKMSAKELLALLKSTDFSHVLEAGDSAMSEKDIEALLNREALLKSDAKTSANFKIVSSGLN